MTRSTYNAQLPELPNDLAFLNAVGMIVERQKYEYGATANDVAHYLGVTGARRLGRGAVAHSWTGTMSAALRVSPRLTSLSNRGLLSRFHADMYGAGREYRWRYALTPAGREVLA